MSGWAIPVALAAAGCFAASTSLQHRASSCAPLSVVTGRQLIMHLWRRPGWLAGIAAGGGGFGLHALALRLGALTVVQPLLVSGVALALPVRAALEHRLPSRLSMLWAVVTATGLALFLVAAAPTTGRPRPDAATGGLCVAAGAGIAAAATLAGTRTDGRRVRGLVLGFAAGVVFGLTAGTLKMTTAAAATSGVAGVFGSWSTYALLGLGVWGLAVNQWAYRSAPLAVSMPILNITSPVVAISFGAAVFDEIPSDRPLVLLLGVVGLVVMTLGVAMLAHSSPKPPRSAWTEPRRIGSVS